MKEHCLINHQPNLLGLGSKRREEEGKESRLDCTAEQERES
jgi:hypothetical protein